MTTSSESRSRHTFGADLTPEEKNARSSIGYHVAPYRDASIRANYYCSHCKQGMGNAYFELREAFDALTAGDLWRQAAQMLEATAHGARYDTEHLLMVAKGLRELGEEACVGYLLGKTVLR